jgi:AbrB family looped-hinge helix DNA binding protein
MEEIIIMDDRGRITIPKEIRERIGTRTLKIMVEGDKIVLEPVTTDIMKYYGIFRKDIGDIDVNKVLKDSLSELIKDDL